MAFPEEDCDERSEDVFVGSRSEKYFPKLEATKNGRTCVLPSQSSEVENTRFELVTSCMPCKRSSQLS